MKEYIDQLMAKMTLQEKIGQLNLMVAGDITTGGAWTPGGWRHCKRQYGRRIQHQGTRQNQGSPGHRHQEQPSGHSAAGGHGRNPRLRDHIPYPPRPLLLLGYRSDEEGRRSIGKGSQCCRNQLDLLAHGRYCTRCRWGRISEGNGEDPYLSGVMGAALTQGYQGADMRTEEILRADRIMACLKHFASTEPWRAERNTTPWI